MMNLFIWLGIVNFLAFFISKSKYTKPFRRKLGSLSDTNINKLKPTYIVLYQLVKCSFCLAFWIGMVLGYQGQQLYIHPFQHHKFHIRVWLQFHRNFGK